MHQQKTESFYHFLKAVKSDDSLGVSAGGDPAETVLDRLERHQGTVSFPELLESLDFGVGTLMRTLDALKDVGLVDVSEAAGEETRIRLTAAGRKAAGRSS